MLFHDKTYKKCSQKGRLFSRADGPYYRHGQNGLFDRVIRAEKSALCSGRLLSTTHEAKASKRLGRQAKPSERATRDARVSRWWNSQDLTAAL